jgi:hypothetical protein
MSESIADLLLAKAEAREDTYKRAKKQGERSAGSVTQDEINNLFITWIDSRIELLREMERTRQKQ